MRNERTPIVWWAGDARVQTALSALLTADREPGRAIVSNARRSLREVRVRVDGDRDPDPLHIVLKTHHVATGRHRLREAVKRGIGRSPARREWRALVALHAAGVPVPCPLACGRLASGDELIAFEFIEGTALRDRFAEADAPARARLVSNLVAALERLHASGHRHGDLHLGNLRARVDTDEIVLLDLQRTRRARAAHDRLRDLAALELSLLRAVWPAADRAALRRGVTRGPDLGEAFDAALQRFAADHLRGRARRGLRRSFERVDAAGRRGLRDRSLPEGALLRLLEHAEQDPLRRSRREGRGWIAEADIEGRAVVVKWRAGEGFLARLAARLRGTSASRAFRKGQRMQLLLASAARPLAYLDERSAGLPGGCWLVLERVGLVDLDAHRPSTPDAARALAGALGDWLGDLHALGLGHADMKGSNVRLRPRDDDEADARSQVTPASAAQPRFWLVDLEDLTGPRAQTDEARLTALAQLNASIPDAHLGPEARREALAHYLARLPLASAALDLEQVEAEIARRSLARAHRWRGEGCASEAKSAKGAKGAEDPANGISRA